MHIAFLLAGLAARIPEYCACSLIIYATYTLDRALDCKEDAINKRELCGADGRIGVIASAIAFLLGAAIFIADGIWLAPFFPFLVGYIYTRGVRIGHRTFKLKGGAGIKNIIIGVTWGGSIALVVARWCSNPVTVGIIFLFFCLKLFCTSCVNDFKDVRGDLAAGIRTLPATFGEALTKKVLILMMIVLHAVMIYALLSAVIRDEWIVVLYSLVASVGFLAIYSSSFEESSSLILKRLRWIVIYWESAITLTLRAVV